MNKCKVFYSWQSDRKPTSRFISKCLNRLNGKKFDFALYEVERDTVGVAGSPDIANTVFCAAAGNEAEKGLRPEFIIVNIYGNASGIEETKELIAKVKLSEKKSELLYTSHFLNGYIWDDRPIDNTDPNV